MAHAIRLLVATPNAPDQAQDKWDNWRTDWSEVLPEQATEYRTVLADPTTDRPKHDKAIAWFDDDEGRDGLVDDLTESAFPSVE